jgi:hypothetical protein
MFQFNATKSGQLEVIVTKVNHLEIPGLDLFITFINGNRIKGIGMGLKKRFQAFIGPSLGDSGESECKQDSGKEANAPATLCTSCLFGKLFASVFPSKLRIIRNYFPGLWKG